MRVEERRGDLRPKKTCPHSHPLAYRRRERMRRRNGMDRRIKSDDDGEKRELRLTDGSTMREVREVDVTMQDFAA